MQPGTMGGRITSPSFQYLLLHPSGKKSRNKKVYGSIFVVIMVLVTISLGLTLKFVVLKDSNLGTSNSTNTYANISTVGQRDDMMVLIGGKGADGTSLKTTEVLGHTNCAVIPR